VVNCKNNGVQATPHVSLEVLESGQYISSDISDGGSMAGDLTKQKKREEAKKSVAATPLRCRGCFCFFCFVSFFCGSSLPPWCP
jgi:hypothetical protein